MAGTTSISGNAEFNAAGVDKGVGLAMLRTKLGIDRMHVIAFGDNENDIVMMKRAKYSFAVANAREEVKRAASRQCGPYWEDGVLVQLKKIAGKQEK